MTVPVTDHTTFQHPLVSRYASAEMVTLWSPQQRHRTWRRVWCALAQAQHAAGLPVTAEQVAALEAAVDDIDFAAARRYEEQFRHDVMAHIHAYGDAAPAARGIIHLGATSMDIVDNADLILTRRALRLVAGRVRAVIAVLANFCEQYADLPTLGFTHLQPAQLTTVGKRAALWLADLVEDLQAITAAADGLKCRGLRGATGTQASFLKLLGSADQVQALETAFAAALEFDDCYPVVGQTYSRGVDTRVMSALASLGATTHRLCNDIRLLAMLKEIEEPFEQSQVGSSAMPYKRNPMRCERATGLARFLMSLLQPTLQVHAEQMLERTLDDSSTKRLTVPEAFLTADALAVLLHSILDGLVVYPAMIASRVAAELPFIATEDILMEAVAAGGDRQELHEKLRQHSQAAGAEIKQHGRPNDLLARLQADPAFAAIDWTAILDPKRYTGLAATQTRDFVQQVVRPILAAGRPISPPQVSI